MSRLNENKSNDPVHDASSTHALALALTPHDIPFVSSKWMVHTIAHEPKNCINGNCVALVGFSIEKRFHFISKNSQGKKQTKRNENETNVKCGETSQLNAINANNSIFSFVLFFYFIVSFGFHLRHIGFHCLEVEMNEMNEEKKNASRKCNWCNLTQLLIGNVYVFIRIWNNQKAEMIEIFFSFFISSKWISRSLQK